VRPRDAEALLSEEAFEHEEFLPYWAELWPSGVALARRVSARALRGAGRSSWLRPRAAEHRRRAGRRPGPGHGLVSDSIAFTRRNAERNGARLETAVCAWDDPELVLGRAPWDLVLAADVLYERRNAAPLLDLLPRLVAPGAEVWLADPDRPPCAGLPRGRRRGPSRSRRCATPTTRSSRTTRCAGAGEPASRRAFVAFSHHW
jgi:hypothetical protein